MSADNYWDEFTWFVEDKGTVIAEFPTKEAAMESLPRYTWDYWSDHDDVHIYKAAWLGNVPVKKVDMHPIIKGKRKDSL